MLGTRPFQDGRTGSDAWTPPRTRGGASPADEEVATPCVVFGAQVIHVQLDLTAPSLLVLTQPELPHCDAIALRVARILAKGDLHASTADGAADAPQGAPQGAPAAPASPAARVERRGSGERRSSVTGLGLGSPVALEVDFDLQQEPAISRRSPPPHRSPRPAHDGRL